MNRKVLAILSIAAFAVLVTYNINVVIKGDAQPTNVALVDVETLAHAVEVGCPACYGSSTCAYHGHTPPGDGVGGGGDGGSAGYPLPGVAIECDRSGSGRCWEEDKDYSMGVFGLPMCETVCTGWSGYTWMICVPGVPC